MHKISRREMMGTTGIALAGAMLGTTRRASAAQAKVMETKVISHQPERYHGWPTIARRANGQLLVVCSGGREAHVCPFGCVELIRSDDGGETWGWPCVVMDCEIDDRDAGVMETNKGTLLVTTFTSLAYESGLKKAEAAEISGSGKWPEDRLRRWRAAHNRLTAEQRQKALSVWMIRSTDEGVTWSGRYESGVNSPHGPIQLSDGRQLYAGKELWSGEHRIGVCESSDDGQSWRWLAEIPSRAGDDPNGYHELHAVEAADGRILVQIRNHNKANSGETLQTESSDGGKTWSEPHSIGVWGLPSHLLRLKDDRLLMTYGHRRPPFGNQARLSNDHGRTWSEAMILSGDGPGGDLGYPSTVQRDDGALVSVWYEVMKGSPHAVLRQAIWNLEG
ncbi:MAG: exo-alpha-sialidase [Rhodopirellula sp.]|nr:exo-alpha-sialidase [Rhodopirellula sp.]